MTINMVIIAYFDNIRSCSKARNSYLNVNELRKYIFQESVDIHFALIYTTVVRWIGMVIVYNTS